MQIIRENKAKIQEMRQANKILKEELVSSTSDARESSKVSLITSTTSTMKRLLDYKKQERS